MLECIRRPSATGAVFCNLRGATGSWRRRHRSRPLRRKAVLLDICRRSCRGPGPHLYGQVMLLHQLRNTYSMITTQGKRQSRCQFPATHCWRARPNRIKGLVSRSFSGLEGGFAFRSAFFPAVRETRHLGGLGQFGCAKARKACGSRRISWTRSGGTSPAPSPRKVKASTSPPKRPSIAATI